MSTGDGQATSPSTATSAVRGEANSDEILMLLNELLEAERAGARVALDSAKVTSLAGYAELMRHVRADEAHWCRMLHGQIQRLGGAPSGKTGAFYDKAVAITNPVERLSFLNRGQQWVVRKLEVLLPRIRDELLQADLREMAMRHQTNIAEAELMLAQFQQSEMK